MCWWRLAHVMRNPRRTVGQLISILGHVGVDAIDDGDSYDNMRRLPTFWFWRVPAGELVSATLLKARLVFAD